MLAGLIVALIGLVSALTTVLDLPRYWTTMLIGAALFLAGAARQALGGRPRDSSGPA
jgi:ABC-type cobalamin transport system permease subunit